MRFSVRQTPEFEKWYFKQSLKIKAQVSDRVERLQNYGHMGNSKAIDNNLFEFRWKNGLRIYFCFNGKEIIILLNGGNKNAQKKDIQKARHIKQKYT